ncbi:protein ACCELERATED CELL DEATH 6-like [Carex rostrata]
MLRNRLKETPLHCAAKAGNYTMVSLLISFAEHEHHVGEETLPTATNMYGETALHEAVRVGNRDIVGKLILSEPSLTGIVDTEGVSPLYLATMMNMLNIVKIFTRGAIHGILCRAKMTNCTTRCCARKCRCVPLWSMLESIEDEATALMDYCGKDLSNEFSGITHTLLEWNKSLATKVDDLESTPLHYAASVGNLATVKLLLQHETLAVYMADKDGLFPIHIAAKYGRTLLIKELIEQFPDSDELLDKEGRNFLQLAILSGKGNIIGSIRHSHTFLRMLNARDYEGNTPLHLASQRGEYRIVRFLISMKMVYSSIMNKDGATPVDLAIKEVDQGYTFKSE